MDQKLHVELIGLIIAWTFTGVIVFTAIVTCLALIGLVTIPAPYMKALFAILIVELVTAAVGFFLNFMHWDPWKVQHEVQASALATGREEGIAFGTKLAAAQQNSASIDKALSVFKDAATTNQDLDKASANLLDKIQITYGGLGENFQVDVDKVKAMLREDKHHPETIAKLESTLDELQNKTREAAQASP
jgi:hypothetical protein